MVNFLGRQLRKFPVNYGDDIKVIIDKNILYAYIYIIEVERLLATLKNLRIAYDISKDEKAKNSKPISLRSGTLPLKYLGNKAFRYGDEVIPSGLK